MKRLTAAVWVVAGFAWIWAGSMFAGCQVASEQTCEFPRGDDNLLLCVPDDGGGG
jgi:hypothetical protein